MNTALAVRTGVTFHDLNGERVGQREDGYVDGTALCRANGKLIADYLRLGSTTAFLSELLRSMGFPIDPLVQVVTTGANDQRGTWVHPLVAYNLGQWCSAKAAVFVSQLLHAIRTGAVRVVPMPGPEMRLRFHQEARFTLAIGRDIEKRDELMLKDSARNLLCDANRPGGFEQVTISARCQERGVWAGLRQCQRIGKAVLKLYRAKYDRDPDQHSQFVDGAVRKVRTYSRHDIDIIDAAIDRVLATSNQSLATNEAISSEEPTCLAS